MNGSRFRTSCGFRAGGLAKAIGRQECRDLKCVRKIDREVSVNA
jgi:hypothetical protein